MLRSTSSSVLLQGDGQHLVAAPLMCAADHDEGPHDLEAVLAADQQRHRPLAAQLTARGSGRRGFQPACHRPADPFSTLRAVCQLAYMFFIPVLTNSLRSKHLHRLGGFENHGTTA